MGLFSNLFGGLFDRSMICPECGSTLEWENEWEETLVCSNCGYERATDSEDTEDYPTKEEVCGEDDEDDEEYESYDEVCGELDDD